MHLRGLAAGFPQRPTGQARQRQSGRRVRPQLERGSKGTHPWVSGGNCPWSQPSSQSGLTPPLPAQLRPLPPQQPQRLSLPGIEQGQGPETAAAQLRRLCLASPEILHYQRLVEHTGGSRCGAVLWNFGLSAPARLWRQLQHLQEVGYTFHRSSSWRKSRE